MYIQCVPKFNDKRALKGGPIYDYSRKKRKNSILIVFSERKKKRFGQIIQAADLMNRRRYARINKVKGSRFFLQFSNTNKYPNRSLYKYTEISRIY